MAFGIPYKGSKNIYAKKILEILPSGRRLVDLFAGGCAITDCAIKMFGNKWDYYLINDIQKEPIDLYCSCLKGECPVSYRWVSREEFATADWATRLVWSFSNDGCTYLYGKAIEDIKKEVELWITDNIKFNSDLLKDIELPDLSDYQSRYKWWCSNRKKLSKGLNLETHRLEAINRLQAIEAINRLQDIERIDRLNKLQNNDILERIEITYNSYELYKYQEGDVVYCDIPYQATTCELYEGFNHQAFWEWAKTQPYEVYISERIIPEGCKVLLKRDVPNRANRKGVDGYKTEYLVCV